MRKMLLALSCLLLLAPMFLVAVTSSAPYDAWSDLDADGDIDIFDVVKIAGAYGTTGDPGKNVNVTNWPTWQNVTVKYAWNKSTEGAVIDGLQSHVFIIPNTGGYREINLGIDPDRDVDVTVSWLVGGAYYSVDSYHAYGGILLVKQYSVQGYSLMLGVYNNYMGSNTVWLDWYITA